MLIVATQIDSASERIINYLSSAPYEININAVTFQCFKDDDNEVFLARTFLIEQDLIHKGWQSLTLEQLQGIAAKNGVGELYKNLESSLNKYFKPRRAKYLLSFTGILGESKNAIFHLVPTMSNPEDGLRFRIFMDRFVKYFNTDNETAISMLPSNTEEGSYGWYEGYFYTMEYVDRFSAWLEKLKPTSSQNEVTT